MAATDTMKVSSARAASVLNSSEVAQRILLGFGGKWSTSLGLGPSRCRILRGAAEAVGDLALELGLISEVGAEPAAQRGAVKVEARSTRIAARAAPPSASSAEVARRRVQHDLAERAAIDTSAT